MMKLILVDTNAQVCLAWERHFRQFRENIDIVHGRFEVLSAFDCLVSPANSFGFMDGGVDLAIANFFDGGLVERVQKYIRQHYAGEQPVGTSFLMHTGSMRHRWLAHTPTMRVCKPIVGTDNVYNAMRAMLIEVTDVAGIHPKTVACPGLGTLTGCMPPEEAARQMAQAYRSVMYPRRVDSWREAMQIEAAASWDGPPVPEVLQDAELVAK